MAVQIVRANGTYEYCKNNSDNRVRMKETTVEDLDVQRDAMDEEIKNIVANNW